MTTINNETATAPPSAFDQLKGLTSWVDRIDARPTNVLGLALWPNEHLLHLHPAERQELMDRAMAGATRREIEAVDGFGYRPEWSDTTLDMNYVMLLAEKNSVVVLQDWVRRWGPGILRHRTNHNLQSALLVALEHRSWEARDFILSCGATTTTTTTTAKEYKQDHRDNTYALGLPEAAALGMQDLTNRLVKEYDEEWPEHRKHPSGLTGVELAYLYSGMSGRIDWVTYWMDKVEDINIGATTSFGNILRYAVRGGNVELVRMLLLEKEIPARTRYNQSYLVQCALADVQMVRFLVEEMGHEVDVMDDGRETPMDTALLGRFTDTSLYLLDKIPLSHWSILMTEHPLSKVIFMWNEPALFVKLLEGEMSRGDAQLMLRQAVRAGNSLVARVLLEEKGATLELKAPFNMVTHFEEAVYSCSLSTVDYVLEKLPAAIEEKHENGFTCLVSAVRGGSPQVLRRLIEMKPDLLQVKFWTSYNLLMLAAQIKSRGAYDVLLEPTFYEEHCRGKALDINSRNDADQTALQLAVGSGDVVMVDRLLACRAWLTINECAVQTKVNELFVAACRQKNVTELLACFDSHGLRLEGTHSESLAMAAASSGALLYAEPGTLDRLRAMDAQARLGVTDEILLHSIVKNAPDWAIETGRLAGLVRSSFVGKECMSSEAVLEQVILRCDVSLAELFSERLKVKDSGDAVWTLLESVGEKESRAHPTVQRRHFQFLVWLIETTDTKAYISMDRVLAVLEKAIAAELDLGLIHGLFPPDMKFHAKKLSPIIFEAVERCELTNVRFLARCLQEPDNLATVRDAEGRNLLAAAFSTNHTKTAGSILRFPLIDMLLQDYNFDLTSAVEGCTLPMAVMELGHVGLVEFMVEKFIDKPGLVLQRTERHESIIFYACKSGHPLVFAKALGVVQADLSLLLGPARQTPVHYAASFGHLPLLRFLIQAMAMDVNARDADARTAIEYAEMGFHSNAEEYLKALTDPSLQVESSPGRKKVNEWLSEIGNSVGKNIHLNSSGISAFTYDAHTIVIEVPQHVESFVIYAAFKGDKYEINEKAMEALLRSHHPSNSFDACFGLDFKGSADQKHPDAIISLNDRMNDIDQATFRDIMERFIVQTRTTGDLLSSFIAQDALESALEGLQDGQPLGRVNFALRDHMAKIPEREPLRPADIQIFRDSLQVFMNEIGKAVRKTIPVNDSGVSAFTYGDLAISVSPSSATKCRLETVVKSYTLQAVPSGVLRHALGLNYLQQGTRGGKISLHRGVVGTDFVFTYEDSLAQITPNQFRYDDHNRNGSLCESQRCLTSLSLLHEQEHFGELH